MDLSDVVALIKPGIPGSSENSVWADLGCGAGTFTNALATLLGAGSKIYAIDKESQLHLSSHTGNTEIEFIRADVELESLPVSSLDGILLANVLHYIKNQSRFIEKIKENLKPPGRIILVEYDRENPNRLVPFPVSHRKAKDIFRTCGFDRVEKIGEKTSIFGQGKMYACSISRSKL